MANDDTRQSAPHDSNGELEANLRRFLERAKPLLIVDASDPIAVQYIAFRNSALDAVESDDIIADTAVAWQKLHENPQTTRAAHLLMMELSAFSAAAEVAEKTPSEPIASSSLKKRLLGIAGTTVDSLSDILKLSDRARAAWKIFGELLSFFRS